MAPPLPEASHPSKRTHTGGPIRGSLGVELAAEREAQLEQPVLGVLQPLGLLLAREAQRQVELVQARHDRNLPARGAIMAAR